MGIWGGGSMHGEGKDRLYDHHGNEVYPDGSRVYPDETVTIVVHEMFTTKTRVAVETRELKIDHNETLNKRYLELMAENFEEHLHMEMDKKIQDTVESTPLVIPLVSNE